ncbi:hypothetical protein CBS101457_000626 [Exobasidium rhododendri]|nr:hypothetical protein CBS101457_000626 [Exobasidium rhododendri]
MSIKFKPTKKAVESETVIDDWEASESEGDDSHREKGCSKDVKLLPSSRIVDTQQDAWGGDGSVYDRLKNGNQSSSSLPQNGRILWQEANRDDPQPQPVLTNRSLPSTVLNPRLTSSTYRGNDHLQPTAPPPPQILRREKAGYGKTVNDKSNEQQKTLKEREEEYRKARERIFGPTISEASTPSPSQKKERNQSHSNGNTQQENKKRQPRVGKS